MEILHIQLVEDIWMIAMKHLYLQEIEVNFTN
jgi:hypothetical protein